MAPTSLHTVVLQIHDTVNRDKSHPPGCKMGRIVWPPDAGQLLVELLRQGLGVTVLDLQQALPPGPAAEEQMGGLLFGWGQQRHHEWGTLINYAAEGRTPIGCPWVKVRSRSRVKNCNEHIVHINTPGKHKNWCTAGKTGTVNFMH